MPSAEACLPEPQSFGREKRLYALIRAVMASSRFSSVTCRLIDPGDLPCGRSLPEDRAVWDGPQVAAVAERGRQRSARAASILAS